MSTLSRKIYCKAFLYKNSGIKQIVGFLDSGSDISICHESYLEKLFSAEEIEATCDTDVDFNLTSYSNNMITLLYSIDVQLGFKKYGKTLSHTLHVVSDIEGAPPLLFGSDLMKATLMNVAYTGSVLDPIPQVKIVKPENTNVITYYAAEQEIYECETEVELTPYESKTCTFYLHPASPCLENDYILISGADTQKDIYVNPSRSRITYDYKKNRYFAKAFVYNVSPYKNTCTMITGYEILSGERIIPITQENRNKLAKYSLVKDVYNFKHYRNVQCIKLTKDLPENIDKCTLVPASVYAVHKSMDSVPVNSASEIPPSELNKFYSSEHTAIAEPDFEDKKDLDPDIALPRGHTIHDDFKKRPEDIVDLSKYDSVQRPYIEDIFLKSYPSVLARGALDAGDLSKTLGFYHLQLKDGQVLPKFKKVFFLNPEETQHLKDILSFLLKNNVITKAATSGDPADLYGSPAYLIAKRSRDSSARLIVDYRNLNSLIKAEPSIIPDIPSTLHSMRNSAMFSSSDLSCAYYSFKLTESSRYLTRFCTPVGCYNYVSLPTGVSISCMCFTTIANRMIHEKPVFDKDGNPIFEKPNVVKMVPDPIPGCLVYFDDLLLHTEARGTYAETVRYHYAKLKLVMSRLAFHNSKIGFEKSTFGKFRIAWLGWLISSNFLCANPKRVQKMLDAEVPQTQKGWRSFIGLLNSIRLTTNFKDFEKLKYLTPLTSSKTPFKPTEFHEKIFNELKQKLTEKPIFTNMICPKSRKLLFTDASSSSNSSYSCCLAQIIEAETETAYVPPHICLDDPVHRIIYDRKLIYQPAPMIRTEEDAKAFHKKLPQTEPPLHEYLDTPYLGYDENQLNDTFFISLQCIQAVYKCKIMPISEMRQIAVKQIKKSVLRIKLNDFVFNNNAKNTRDYLDQLEKDAPPDPEMITIEGLAYGLFRPIIVLSSLVQHEKSPVIQFNSNMEKPPLVVGAYQCGKHVIFRPFYINRETCYDLRQHRNRFEIVAYHSRAMPQTKTGQHIMQHELYAILASLQAMKRYIGHSEVTLLTDSKPLYMLFNKHVHASSVKLYRWSMKLSVDYPNLKLQYIRSDQNLADFLSKKFHALPGDLPRLALTKITVDDIDKYLPQDKVFSISEWQEWCRENPDYIKELTDNNSHAKTLLTASLQTVTRNLEKHIKPLAVLEERLSHENILRQQKIEFKDLYSACVTAKDFHFFSDDESEYKLVNALIVEMTNDGPKILVPPSMLGVLLAYYHLNTGHGGQSKLTAALHNYTFPNKSTTIYNFCSRCYSCQLNNRTTKQEVVGMYPISSYPFEVLHMDIAENLGKSGRYEHILICTCLLSSAVILIPLKNKTAEAVSNALLYNVLQFYRVAYLASDNAPGFNDRRFIEFIATVGIRKFALSALNPQGKGTAEARVRQVKVLLRKFLVSHDTYDWQGLVYLVSKIINTTKNATLKMTPFEYIYGPQSEHAVDPFENLTLPKLHPLIADNSVRIKENQIKLKNMIAESRKILFDMKLDHNEKINKNRIKKDFKKGDIVFCLDTQIIPGSTRPLKSPYHPSPYVVLSVYPTTCLIKRLADAYTQVYSKNNMKKYNKMDPKFLNLPTPVLNIIKGDSDQLDAIQLEILQKYDNFSLPQGQMLTIEPLNKMENNDMLNQKTDTLNENIDEKLNSLPVNNDSNDNNSMVDSSTDGLPIKIDSSTDTAPQELELHNRESETGSGNLSQLETAALGTLPRDALPAESTAQPDTHRAETSKLDFDESSDDDAEPETNTGMNLRSGKTVSFKD